MPGRESPGDAPGIARSSRGVVHFDGASMPLDRLLYQAEAEACASHLCDTGPFTAVEGFEDAFAFRVWDSWAAIGDSNFHCVVVLRRRNAYPSTLRRVARRIRDQITKTVLECDRIAGDRGQAWRYSHFDVAAGLFDLRRHRSRGMLQEIANGKRLTPVLPAGMHGSGKGQNILYHRREFFGVPKNEFRVTLDRVRLAHYTVREVIRSAPDGSARS